MRLGWPIAIPGIAALTAAVLLAMGRVPICEWNHVKPWHGVTVSSANSRST